MDHMEIKKFWKNDVNSEDNFIVITDESIYRIRAKKENRFEIGNELSNKNIRESFVSIPIIYLRSISFSETDKRIRIIYKKESEEELLISNPSLRKEIFEYLKENHPTSKYKKINLSVFKRIKKPLIALFVVIGIFAFILFFINELEQGTEYRITGRPGIGAIALGLANLGLFKNILIFAPLGIIALLKIVKNYKSNSEYEVLEYR